MAEMVSKEFSKTSVVVFDEAHNIGVLLFSKLICLPVYYYYYFKIMFVLSL